MTQHAKTYQAYYTKSASIVGYMVKQLQLKPTDRIFEPCGGDGVFVDDILSKNENALIDIFELNPTAFHLLQNKFSIYPQLTIRNSDTLLDNELLFGSEFGGIYDKIIANPPYGAWQDIEKRNKIKHLYPTLYTKETYTLFLYRCIELLKDGGILTFIIPDTFLNLHSHKAIRKHILTKTKILELVLFPASFFPGVNFGYANLSILTLQKESNKQLCLANNFKIKSAFSYVEQLEKAQDASLKITTFCQNEILQNPDHAFLISDNTAINQLINHTKVRIGDIADCVTGFYSGNDKRFLQVGNSNLKNGKNYELVDKNSINETFGKITNLLEGIEGEKHFLPIVKGGNTKFLKPDNWYMNWSKAAVEHYKKDKKARFQNPNYYFKFGIGVPMISSSNITAALIENKLFDQSIVGIFPKDKALTFYLLAFFNSPTCNQLIRTINPSANNPANYIKKIPFIKPSNEELKEVTNIVEEIITDLKSKGNYNSLLEEKLNKIIKNTYLF